MYRIKQNPTAGDFKSNYVMSAFKWESHNMWTVALYCQDFHSFMVYSYECVIKHEFGVPSEDDVMQALMKKYPDHLWPYDQMPKSDAEILAKSLKELEQKHVEVISVVFEEVEEVEVFND